MEDRTDLRLDDEGDAKITAMLRDVYTPPAEGAYWDGLETRIMVVHQGTRSCQHSGQLVV
jgi:hypothetical protein